MAAPVARTAALLSLAIALPACGSVVSPFDPTDAGDAAAQPDAARGDAVVDTSGGDVAPDASSEVANLGDALVAGDALPPPPPPPTDAGTITGSTRWYVVNTLKLGLTPRGSSVHDVNAWKDYGYDLDGRITTADDSKLGTNTCKRLPGSPSGILTDGNGGRDDNFGGHVMQVMAQLQSGIEDSQNQAIANGGTTLILRLDNVGAGDNAHVPGALYATGPLANGSTPRFDGSDIYRVLASSLTDGVTIGSAKATFPGGYMTGGVWVSGLPSPSAVALLPLAIFGGVPIPVSSPIVSFRVADGSEGTIAGAVGVGAFTNALAAWAPAFGICPSSSTYQQIVITMTQSADLVLGAPQLQNPAVTCDAISLGIGFTTRPVLVSTTAAPAPPPAPDLCGSDAGTGDGGVDASIPADRTTGKSCLNDNDCDLTGNGIAHCTATGLFVVGALNPSPICMQFDSSGADVCDPGPLDASGKQLNVMPCDGDTGLCTKSGSSTAVCDARCELDDTGKWIQPCLGRNACTYSAVATDATGRHVMFGTCMGGCSADADCPSGSRCDATEKICVSVKCTTDANCTSRWSGAPAAWRCETSSGYCKFLYAKKPGDLCDPTVPLQDCACYASPSATQGVCATLCKTGAAADCAAGLVCDPVLAATDGAGAPIYAASFTLPAGLSGWCLPPCASDAECKAGQKCGLSAGMGATKTCR
jgi:hypothetical protein